MRRLLNLVLLRIDQSLVEALANRGRNCLEHVALVLLEQVLTSFALSARSRALLLNKLVINFPSEPTDIKAAQTLAIFKMTDDLLLDLTPKSSRIGSNIAKVCRLDLPEVVHEIVTLLAESYRYLRLIDTAMKLFPYGLERINLGPLTRSYCF